MEELRFYIPSSVAKKKEKKLNIEFPYDPAIPVISICPKEMKIRTHTTPDIRMFTVASLTIAKRWRQTKCSSTDEGINESWNILKPQKEMKCPYTLQHGTSKQNLKNRTPNGRSQM